MKQVLLAIYKSSNSYETLLHIPKSKDELVLWIQAELCKKEYKGKEWDLFVLKHTGKGQEWYEQDGASIPKSKFLEPKET